MDTGDNAGFCCPANRPDGLDGLLFVENRSRGPGRIRPGKLASHRGADECVRPLGVSSRREEALEYLVREQTSAGSEANEIAVGLQQSIGD